MTKHKKKYQKCIKIDAHFKYKCINSDCGYDHWLSLNEAKTKNFKIVCECGTIFCPKQIFKIKVIYKKSDIKLNDKKSAKISIDVSSKIVSDCSNALVQYGFTQDEAKQLVIKEYERLGNSNIKPLELIKEILKNLETNS